MVQCIVLPLEKVYDKIYPPSSPQASRRPGGSKVANLSFKHFSLLMFNYNSL